VTKADAADSMWSLAADSIGYLGLVAGALLALALIGMAARW